MATPLKQSIMVMTTRIKDSIRKVDVPRVRFGELWDAYPHDAVCDASDARSGRDRQRVANPCAMRVSHALGECGVTFKSYPARRMCAAHPGEHHCLSARELADWLALQPFVGCRKMQVFTSDQWRARIAGRSGILYFDHDDAAAASGAADGHIDLWNGSRMTDWSSGVRIRFGIVMPGIWPDLRHARTVRFFPVSQ